MRYSARRRFGALVVSTAAIAGFIGVGTVVSGAGGSTAADMLDGKLLIAHGSASANTSNAFHTMQAAVKTDKGLVKLRIPHAKHAQFMALAGRKVRVRGQHTTTQFLGESLAAADSAPAVAAAPRAMRIAVVMMHLPGSKAESATKAHAEATVFGATSSVAHWMSEVSGGQVQVTGKVFGYYDTQLKSGDCDLAHWQTDGERAAKADGYKTADYDHIVVYTPSQGCGFSGVAWIRNNGVYINGAMYQTVIQHELGHNLGPWHSGTLKCSGVYGGSCTRSDYGDPYDVMGRSSGNRHYTAAHKAMIGWLPAANVKTVTSGTATIDLTASEQPVAGATQMIALPITGTNTKYVIERRASFGYDQGLSGVWIRVQGPANSSLFGTTDSLLLDMTPSTNGTFTDGNLAAGKSYTDTNAKITISVLSDTASSPTARVQVCYGTCTTSGPTTTITTTTVPPSSTTTTTTTTAVPTNKVSIAVVSRALVIAGTAANESILVTKVRNNRYSVAVAGAPLALGPGCTQVDDVVTCAGGKSVRIDGGGGNDTLRVSGSVRSTLTGGSGNDTLQGGTAADVFAGGIGTDVVDYTNRIGETIIATPGTGNDDGRRRERDDIGADVEQVRLP